eukprot:scaffold1581_cov342-Prasinococcus_capsulatus_cf.AAC.2
MGAWWVQVMQRPKLIFVGPDAAKYKPGRPTRIQMADTLTAHLHREAAAYIDLQSGKFLCCQPSVRAAFPAHVRSKRSVCWVSAN